MQGVPKGSGSTPGPATQHTGKFGFPLVPTGGSPFLVSPREIRPWCFSGAGAPLPLGPYPWEQAKPVGSWEL